ncbi:hypothetical protein DH2020_028510 [Rehmannia glutinosa]|uniref:Glycosyltransferase n=1 Tax=Rehmannia glutinosa TaxID=99300 RepID=A0ABR0VR77_REHGL
METLETAKPVVVVLVPFPLQGHLTPMLQLGTILHSRGFSIVIAHTQHFNPPNPTNHPEFTFVPLSDGLSGRDASSAGNFLEIISAINTNCKQPLEDCIMNKLEGQVACIIYDSLMYFVDDVAHQLKLPSIFFRATTALYMQSYYAVLALEEKKMLPLPESQLQEPVPELHSILRYQDLPISVSSKISETLIQFIKSFSNIRSSVAVIWNSIEMLDHLALHQLQHQYQVPCFPIGPIHKLSPSPSQTSLLPEDTTCITWLDKHAPKSVLYVSLGSLATMGDKELVETAWGIANSGQKFLWVVRPSSVNGSDWIECLPDGFAELTRERGLIVKWAPQKKVLAHWAVGGFLSHCGWNSTLESICEGVPMICRPCFGDQMMNARFLVHVWKMGIELGKVVERESVEKAIRMVMVDELGNEMRHTAVEMKGKLELSVRKDGSSYRSLDELVEFIISLIHTQNMN